MKAKILANILSGSIAVCSVLGLNAIATTIDHPELSKPQIESSEPVTVVQLELENYIDQTAQRYRLDPKVVKAVIEEESGWISSAEGDEGEAIGLMQIQPRWHQERMKRLCVTDLYDGEQNILVGCDLLSELLERYEDYKTALSVYNSGNTEDGLAYAERILRCIE